MGSEREDYLPKVHTAYAHAQHFHRDQRRTRRILILLRQDLWEEELQGRNSITVYAANQVLDKSRRDVTGMMNCQSNCADSHRPEPGESEVGD